MSNLSARIGWPAVLAAVWLAVAPLHAACADDAAKPATAPRAAVVIGGVSVVLISADDKILAFVDRIADNAPAEDATLKLRLRNGTGIDLAPATAGMFVGPFKHAGRTQDGFVVAVASAAGTGDAQTEIVYADAADAAPPPADGEVRSILTIALVAGAIGVAAAASVVTWLQGRRRKAAAAHIT